MARVARMRKQLEEPEEDSGVEAEERSMYMAIMTTMPKVVRQLPKERLGMWDEREQGTHDIPNTKDMYVDGGSKVHGKTQLHGATT